MAYPKKRPTRKPKDVDLTVASVADLMLGDTRMGLEPALAKVGLTIQDIPRERLETVVRQVIERGWMPDEVAREYVKSVRRLGLTQAVEMGDNEGMRDWSDAIASEPGVGLQKQAAAVEVNIDLGNLPARLQEALNEPAPYLPLTGAVVEAKSETPTSAPDTEGNPQ